MNTNIPSFSIRVLSRLLNVSVNKCIPIINLSDKNDRELSYTNYCNKNNKINNEDKDNQLDKLKEDTFNFFNKIGNKAKEKYNEITNKQSNDNITKLDNETNLPEQTKYQETVESINQIEDIENVVELLLICNNALLFVGKNYNTGLKDIITFDKLEKICYSEKEGEQDQIIFYGISQYDFNNNIIKTQEYLYQIKFAKKVAFEIKQLYDLYFIGDKKELKVDVTSYNEKMCNKVKEIFDKYDKQKEVELKRDLDLNALEEELEEEDNELSNEDKCIKYKLTENENNSTVFEYNGYKFELDSKYQDDLLEPGIYYKLRENIKKKGIDINNILPYETKICIFIDNEKPIENLTDNSTLNSIKYQAQGNMKYYLSLAVDKLGIYSSSPLMKLTKETDKVDKSQWKGYQADIKTKIINGKNYGYKLKYYYIRRKYIPPFFESYNDFIIVLVQSYTIENKDIEFDEVTNKEINQLISSLYPINVSDITYINENMLLNKIESYLVDGKALKYYNNVLNIYGKDTLTLVNDFRIKLRLVYENFSSIYDFTDFEYEVESYLKKEQNKVNISEYKKDIKFRAFKDIVEFPIKKNEKIFDKKDSQNTILFESKVLSFICQNLVEKVFEVDILDVVLKLAQKRNDFLIEMKEPFNYLLNFYILDYNNVLIKKGVNIAYIIDNINNIQELFFNEKFLGLMISHNLLMQIQDIKSNVTYFKFIRYILIHKLSYKLMQSLALYFELIRNESPIYKNCKDELDIETDGLTVIHNTNIIVPVIFYIFIKYKDNSLMVKEATKCLKNLILLDCENRKYIEHNDFYSILAEHLISSDDSVIYNIVSLLALLTRKKYDQTYIFENNKKLFHRLIKLFKGVELFNHYYSPDVILLLLKYFNKLILNYQIKEILLKPNNKIIIKYILKYIDNFDKERYSMYYNQVMSAASTFLNNFSSQDSDMKHYLEDHYQSIMNFKSE